MDLALPSFGKQGLCNQITLAYFLFIQNKSVLNKGNIIFFCYFSWAIIKHYHLEIIKNTPVFIVELNQITPCHQNGRCGRKHSTILPIHSSQTCLWSAHDSHYCVTLTFICFLINKPFYKQRNSSSMGYWTVFECFVDLHHFRSYLFSQDSQTHNFYRILWSSKGRFASGFIFIVFHTFFVHFHDIIFRHFCLIHFIVYKQNLKQIQSIFPNRLLNFPKKLFCDNLLKPNIFDLFTTQKFLCCFWIVSYNNSKMEEKLLLINSMQKLINHIVVSKKNQEEIFASLSKNDFKKIISNLEDDNQKLRKISLAIISQLLHNNHALKQKFCSIMNIPIVPGRVSLNTKLCAVSSKPKNTVTVDMSKNIKEVFTLIKQPISDNEKQSLFWYINFETKNVPYLQLEYVTPTPGQNLQINNILDPIDSMVGFVLTERVAQKKAESFIQSQIVETRRKSEYDPNTSTRMVNNYFKPSIYKPEGIRQTPTVNLNQSLNMMPGYSTDRQFGYIPKTTTSGLKAMNTTVYQDSSHHYSKTIQSSISPPLNQIRNNVTADYQNRSKIMSGGTTGIKLISTGVTGVRKEPGKYGQQASSINGSLSMMNGSKIANQATNSIITGKPSLGGRVQRGYQTLREKKILQKYSMD